LRPFLLARVVTAGQVHLGERHAEHGKDHLPGLSVDRREHGAQRLVPRYQVIERGPQRDRVWWLLPLDRVADVICRVLWAELVQEPQATLREGQRRLRRPAPGDRALAFQLVEKRLALRRIQAGEQLSELGHGAVPARCLPWSESSSSRARS